MNRKVATIIGLQAFLIIVMFWVLVFYGKDEYEAYTSEREEEVETPNRVTTDLGTTVVTLNEAGQKQSDIRTTVMRSSKFQSAISSYGLVMGIDPLIDLRTRYLAARAEAGVVRASLLNSEREYQRLLQLNKDDHNISDRAVVASEAIYKADKAKLAAAETAASNIRDNMRQIWGEVLTRKATEQNDPALQALLEYKQVLLQISLPFGTPEPKPGSHLLVTPTGTQNRAVEARFISSSPQTDSTIQGKTYYYQAPASDLRAGMRVSVRLAENSQSVDGVVVPNEAVVWYGGKAWVYRKEGSDRFVRQPINTDQEAGHGWFTSGQVKPGDALVTSGAQLLLSEEFKYQIKNENED
jgi:hypothetical protein